MPTIKEREEATVKNQLDLAVRNLITAMNSESDFNIAIVEEETDPPWFEISVEYPPYENSPQKFQRRVSNFKAEEIARNIYYIIKDFFGYKYEEEFKLLKPCSENSHHSYRHRDSIGKFTDYNRIFLHEIIHIRIGFIEKRRR